MIIHVNPPQQNPTAEVSGKASAVLGGRREEATDVIRPLSSAPPEVAAAGHKSPVLSCTSHSAAHRGWSELVQNTRTCAPNMYQPLNKQVCTHLLRAPRKEKTFPKRTQPQECNNSGFYQKRPCCLLKLPTASQNFTGKEML